MFQLNSGFIKWKHLFLILVLFAAPVQADELLLVNGDRLSGTVKSMDGGKLTLSTEYGGDIKIKLSSVKKIITEEPVRIHLDNGWKLKGSLTPIEGGGVRVKSAQTGQSAVVDWRRITAVNPPESNWSGSISAGGSMQSGNTDLNSITLGFETNRKTEDDRFRLRFLHNYSDEDDSVTSRNTYGSMKIDHFVKRPLYVYFAAEMLKDEFKDLNLRTILGPGVGYSLWDDAKSSLDLEAGVTYFSQDHELGVDEQWATYRLGAEYALHWSDRLKFNVESQLYPRVDDTGDYKWRNESNIKTSLGSGWALKLTNLIEYDSKPTTGIKETDVTSTLALDYDF